MSLDLLRLRALAEYRKRTRAWRSARARRAEKANPMTNDFDRAELQVAALERVIDRTPAHPDPGSDCAVYSTYCGTVWNATLDRKNRPRDYPHYFVSNNRHVLGMAAAIGWKPIFLDLPVTDNPIRAAHQAKVAKAMPGLFPDLARHRFLVYSDDKQKVPLKQVPEILGDMQKAGAALALRESSHIEGNVLWEFTDSLFQPRYQAQAHQMTRFVLRQMAEGRSLSARHLYNTMLIFRDTAHPQAAALDRAWYEGILDCGIDCQLAFDFLAQDNPAILPLPPKARRKYLGRPIDPDAPRTA